MQWEVHPEAAEELKELPEQQRKTVKESIESRRNRENSILNQRNVGISYDNHGEPIHYFKVSEEETGFRVFFDILDEKLVILGVRERNDDTYLNLREYTKRRS